MTCVKETLDVTELRLLVDDMDPESQLFTDQKYQTMYKRFPNIYRLAAHIWMLKATRLQSQTGGGIKSYTSADEKYEMSNLKDIYDYHVSMRHQMIELAEQYEKDCEGLPDDDDGSMILSFRRPEII